jgi:hypothetical protein
MPFRSIVAEPEELAKLSEAFDRAWIEINEAAPVDPLAAAAARERLGYIIVGLWKLDPRQDLASTAVRLFTSTADAAPTAAMDLAQSLINAQRPPIRRARP